MDIYRRGAKANTKVIRKIKKQAHIVLLRKKATEFFFYNKKVV